MLNHKIIGTGRPVLMLHGVRLDHHHMEAIMEPAFAGTEGWQRIYVDLPGHGASPPQDTIRAQDDLLAALEEFVTECIPQGPFAIAGLSRGSYLARGLIYRHAARVAGAALIVPGGNPSSANPLPAHQVLKPDPALRATLPEEELWAFDNVLVAQRPDIVEKRRRLLMPAIARHDPVQEARVFANFDFSFDAEEAQAPFDGPSVIIAGRQDAYSGYLDALDLSARFPRATLAVLDTAGHALTFERPELFTELIRDWIARLASAWPDAV